MLFSCSNCRGLVEVEETDCSLPVSCGHCNTITMVPDSYVSSRAVIDDFVISKELGHGGVGNVYLAHQLSLDRPVALKILMEQFSQNTEFIEGFIKEARSAARLNHPNIVQYYAVGEEAGHYFCAMEFVDGKTLKDILAEEGRLSIEYALKIINQISDGLDFAWKNQQLVHRDIKPDNIMITAKGVAKLADLGLARAAEELRDDDSDEVMGTPQYISPEQLIGAPMDGRGDIYSLGATFFHIITGRFPFEGSFAAEIARKHLNEELVSPRTIVPDIPESICFVIQKMMAKHPDDRYKDAEELSNDLSLIRSGNSPIAKPSFPTNSKKLVKSNKQSDTIRSKKSKKFKTSSRLRKSTKHSTGNKKTSQIDIKGPSPESESGISDTIDGAHYHGDDDMDPMETGVFKKMPKKRTLTSVKLKNPKSKRTLTGTGSSVNRVDGPGTIQGTTLDVIAIQKKKEEASRKSKKIFMLLGVSLVLISVLGGGFFFYEFTQKNKTDEEKEIEKFQDLGISLPTINSYLEIKKIAKQTKVGGKGYISIMQKVANFRDENPKRADLLKKIYKSTSKFTEDEVYNLRAKKYKKEKQKILKIKELIDAEDKRIALAKEESDRKKRLKEKQEEKKRILEEKKIEKRDALLAQKDELRANQYLLCHKYEFEKARKIFNDMALSDEKDFAKWAKNKQKAIELALEAYKIVWQSSRKFKGYKYKYRGKFWRVKYIGRNDITIEYLDLNGKRKKDKKGKDMLLKLPITNISAPEMLRMSKFINPKISEDSQFNLNFASFLYCIGYFKKAKQMLEASTLAIATFMNNEMDEMESSMKQYKWKEEYAKLEAAIEEGNTKKAKYIAKVLKAKFPDRYEENSSEINELLEE